MCGSLGVNVEKSARIRLNIKILHIPLRTVALSHVISWSVHPRTVNSAENLGFNINIATSKIRTNSKTNSAAALLNHAFQIPRT